MASKNYYDVTRWPGGDPYADIGAVINSILADIKSRQTDLDIEECGKPGAVIYIPPGDYHLTATTEIAGKQASEADSCFSAQVDALLTAELRELDVTAVLVEKESFHNVILDTGSDAQVIMDRSVNTFRAVPAFGG